MTKPCSSFVIGLVAAVVMLLGTMAMGNGTADASTHHGRFATPNGGRTCNWITFQPRTDWGAGNIVVKHVSCKKARAVIIRFAKYGKPIAWSHEVRSHPVGLNHADVRLGRGRAVVVFSAF